VFQKFRGSPNVWATVFQITDYATFDKKMGWAAFWAIFLQTHLVTLQDTLTTIRPPAVAPCKREEKINENQ
jgi:hypothetical protein